MNRQGWDFYGRQYEARCDRQMQEALDLEDSQEDDLQKDALPRSCPCYPEACRKCRMRKTCTF